MTLSLLPLILGLTSNESEVKTFKVLLITYKSSINPFPKAFLKASLKICITKQIFFDLHFTWFCRTTLLISSHDITSTFFAAGRLPYFFPGYHLYAHLDHWIHFLFAYALAPIVLFSFVRIEIAKVSLLKIALLRALFMEGMSSFHK